jgi:hypothetical protein
MWHDIEDDVDLLNFGLVANAAATLIKSAGEAPITIGVSGGWALAIASSGQDFNMRGHHHRIKAIFFPLFCH